MNIDALNHVFNNTIPHWRDYEQSSDKKHMITLERLQSRKDAQWDRMQFSLIVVAQIHDTHRQDTFTLKASLGKTIIGTITISHTQMELYRQACRITNSPVSDFTNKNNILKFIKWIYYFKQYIGFEEIKA